MDNFSIHSAPYPRLHPHACPVRKVGYCRRKAQWIRHAFVSFNYSFLLRGEGEYRTGGRTRRVVSPCVITQWPGVYVEYGPDGTWEELYVIYAARAVEFFRERRLADPAEPVWPVRDPVRVYEHLKRIADHAARPGEPGEVDRIDRECERLVMESLLARRAEHVDPRERAVGEILATVRQDCASEHDFDEMALAAGLSPSTFRRYWARMVGVPPARYAMQARIRKACRLLAETDLAVGEIAARVGFSDPLYFSRRFRKETGVCATDYRARHADPLSLSSGEGA